MKCFPQWVAAALFALLLPAAAIAEPPPPGTVNPVFYRPVFSCLEQQDAIDAGGLVIVGDRDGFDKFVTFKRMAGDCIFGIPPADAGWQVGEFVVFMGADPVCGGGWWVIELTPPTESELPTAWTLYADQVEPKPVGWEI